jgi:septal ring factor EnvC (AmiA/AmiB activator)
MLGLKLAGIMLVLMVVMSGGFYIYYKDSQERMAQLHANNAKLETAVQTSEAAVTALQDSIKRANEEMQKINTEFSEIRAQNGVLADKLAKHDLAVLGQNKPGLVQKIINNATVKAGRCFELLSGAQLTEAEKDAKNSKEFNSECPWLWPGAKSTP